MPGAFNQIQSGPAGFAAAVSPSDSADVTTSFDVRGLWVGGAGNVAVRLPGSVTAVTFVGVAAGTLLPIQAVRVMSTNTTATSIVALG